jgi:hypothetical protein
MDRLWWLVFLLSIAILVYTYATGNTLRIQALRQRNADMQTRMNSPIGNTPVSDKPSVIYNDIFNEDSIIPL